MVALAALERNPVAFEVVDEAGHHSVSAERGKHGKVWLTCQCPTSWSDGWCRHRVNLLCFRYDALIDGSARARRAFEQIVAGTSLHSAAEDADNALKAFDASIVAFDSRRPDRIVGRDLGRFAESASDLAAVTGELVDALDKLRRLLERD
jgi:hypothetical protein